MTLETAFFYLFSTEAQCFAAIAGLALVAAHFRITFLDSRITAIKKTLICELYGWQPSGLVDFRMASMDASDVVNEADTRTLGAPESEKNREIKPLADKLDAELEKIHLERWRAVLVIATLLFGTAISAVQIPFARCFGTGRHSTAWFVVNLLVVIGILSWTGYLTAKSLEVRRSRKRRAQCV